MSIHGNLFAESVLATEDMSALQYKVVTVDGTICNNEVDGYGILLNKPQSGQVATVAVAGLIKGQAGGTISKGDFLTSGDSGFLFACNSGIQSCGIATIAANSGSLVTGWFTFNGNKILAKGLQKGQILMATGSNGVGWKELVWKDEKGEKYFDSTGPNAPSLAVYAGNARGLAFASGDLMNYDFHMQHDYALGTDLFLHAHWLHNGTAISGALAIEFDVDYAKGHQQESFGQRVIQTFSFNTSSIGNVPQLEHRIDEIQISATAASSTQLATGRIEPDGILAAQVKLAAQPTITGGTSSAVFILKADLHYLADRIGTLNKSPDFYS